MRGAAATAAGKEVVKLLRNYRLWRAMGFRRRDAAVLAIKYLNL